MPRTGRSVWANFWVVTAAFFSAVFAFVFVVLLVAVFLAAVFLAVTFFVVVVAFLSVVLIAESTVGFGSDRIFSAAGVVVVVHFQTAPESIQALPSGADEYASVLDISVWLLSCKTTKPLVLLRVRPVCSAENAS